jgi:hypothetical protein
MPRERQNELGRSPEPPRVVAYLIDTLRGLFQEEFETADRLSGKARQAFALAVGFFALVQTVAFNNFAKASENGSDTKWILIVALIAIVPVAIAAGVTIWADSLVPGRRFPLRIVEYLLEASYENRMPTSWDDDQITPNLRNGAVHTPDRSRAHDRITEAHPAFPVLDFRVETPLGSLHVLGIRREDREARPSSVPEGDATLAGREHRS